MGRARSCVMAVFVVASLMLLAGCTVTASSGRASSARPTDSAAASIEQAIPAPSAPSMSQVRGQLEMARSGTGVSVPARLHLGAPVRLFRLKAHAVGDSVPSIIDSTRVALLYPVLSDTGLEAELTFEPWNPGSFKNGGLGDFGQTMPVSSGQAAEYERRIAALPSVGSSPTVGVLALGVDYLVPVAWTPTAAVGVFYSSGLTGGGGPGHRSPPYVPTGVVYRDSELLRRIHSGVHE